MLCILCLKDSNQVIQIFEEEGIRLNVSSIVMLHFSMQPSPENPNNEAICTSCWNELNHFHKFYEKVEAAHSDLIRTWTAATTETPDILSTAIQIAGINQDSDEEFDLEISSTDDDHESDFEEAKLRQTSSPDIDQFIQKHMKLSCDICKKPMYNFKMLQKHFESVHNEIGYVSCCKFKFKKRSSLANHIYLDHNLVDLCDQCGQLSADCKALNLHGSSNHVNNRLSSINVTNSVTLHFKNPVQGDQLEVTLNGIRRGF